MRKHHVFRPLSGLAALCLLSVPAVVTPTAYAFDCKYLPAMQQQAQSGLTSAQWTLGLLYVEGQCVNQDDRSAVEWFRKAAEQGDMIGQFYLGEMYKHGRGVPKSRQKAVEWWRKAAAQNYAQAQENLRELGESW